MEADNSYVNNLKRKSYQMYGVRMPGRSQSFNEYGGQRSGIQRSGHRSGHLTTLGDLPRHLRQSGPYGSYPWVRNELANVHVGRVSAAHEGDHSDKKTDNEIRLDNVFSKSRSLDEANLSHLRKLHNYQNGNTEPNCRSKFASDVQSSGHRNSSIEWKRSGSTEIPQISQSKEVTQEKHITPMVYSSKVNSSAMFAQTVLHENHEQQAEGRVTSVEWHKNGGSFLNEPRLDREANKCDCINSSSSPLQGSGDVNGGHLSVLSTPNKTGVRHLTDNIKTQISKTIGSDAKTTYIYNKSDYYQAQNGSSSNDKYYTAELPVSPTSMEGGKNWNKMPTFLGESQDFNGNTRIDRLESYDFASTGHFDNKNCEQLEKMHINEPFYKVEDQRSIYDNSRLQHITPAGGDKLLAWGQPDDTLSYRSEWFHKTPKISRMQGTVGRRLEFDERLRQSKNREGDFRLSSKGDMIDTGYDRRCHSTASNNSDSDQFSSFNIEKCTFNKGRSESCFYSTDNTRFYNGKTTLDDHYTRQLRNKAGMLFTGNYTKSSGEILLQKPERMVSAYHTYPMQKNNTSKSLLNNNDNKLKHAVGVKSSEDNRIDNAGLDFSVIESTPTLDLHASKEKSVLRHKGTMGKRRKPTRSSIRSSLASDTDSMFEDSTEPRKSRASSEEEEVFNGEVSWLPSGEQSRHQSIEEEGSKPPPFQRPALPGMKLPMVLPSLLEGKPKLRKTNVSKPDGATTPEADGTVESPPAWLREAKVKRTKTSPLPAREEVQAALSRRTAGDEREKRDESPEKPSWMKDALGKQKRAEEKMQAKEAKENENKEEKASMNEKDRESATENAHVAPWMKELRRTSRTSPLRALPPEQTRSSTEDDAPVIGNKNELQNRFAALQRKSVSPDKSLLQDRPKSLTPEKDVKSVKQDASKSFAPKRDVESPKDAELKGFSPEKELRSPLHTGTRSLTPEKEIPSAKSLLPERESISSPLDNSKGLTPEKEQVDSKLISPINFRSPEPKEDTPSWLKKGLAKEISKTPHDTSMAGPEKSPPVPLQSATRPNDLDLSSSLEDKNAGKPHPSRFHPSPNAPYSVIPKDKSSPKSASLLTSPRPYARPAGSDSGRASPGTASPPKPAPKPRDFSALTTKTEESKLTEVPWGNAKSLLSSPKYGMKSRELKPLDSKTSDMKPTASNDFKSTDLKTSESKPSMLKPSELKHDGLRHSELKPLEPKSSPLKPRDLKPSELKSSDSKPSHLKPSKSRQVTSPLLSPKTDSAEVPSPTSPTWLSSPRRAASPKRSPVAKDLPASPPMMQLSYVASSSSKTKPPIKDISHLEVAGNKKDTIRDDKEITKIDHKKMVDKNLPQPSAPVMGLSYGISPRSRSRGSGMMTAAGDGKVTDENVPPKEETQRKATSKHEGSEKTSSTGFGKPAYTPKTILPSLGHHLPGSSPQTSPREHLDTKDSSVPSWKLEADRRRQTVPVSSLRNTSTLNPTPKTADSNTPPWKTNLAEKSKTRTSSDSSRTSNEEDSLHRPSSPVDSTIPPWKQELALRKKRSPRESGILNETQQQT
ncbi:uncharacterized protein LOC106171386 isoform X2 [Lingula anatina]|uniref:Uncharacterized protein LOC106171386 isoform X2 n=1 Tax=Lingula anatina TaxID=7574 RepID=A0A1S3J9T2_LINAN|nr:uncharacterized protein LOC106171386 isoform X2 [Lingula anatina]|eukprot:XP_013407162.1 uncharacterized protein LOC106171386 isoform X2 [Lingula anatina]